MTTQQKVYRSCTGCFESEDGHPVGEYPRHHKPELGRAHMSSVRKPCPWCGISPSMDTKMNAAEEALYRLRCRSKNCNADVATKWKSTKLEALRVWNRRVG